MDNAILAFPLVHWISVTSHYTCVSPYMEMTAANVAQHSLSIKLLVPGSHITFRSFHELKSKPKTERYKFKFNKTVIPFALVGHKIGNSQLGATRLAPPWLFTISYPTGAHGLIVN